jgi:hypothetical protein
MSAFDLYDALVEAGASDATARKAADTVFAEPRLSKIEADVVGIKTDIVGIKMDIAGIKAELRALQTGQGRMFTAMLACFALQTTLTLAGFGWVLNKLP